MLHVEQLSRKPFRVRGAGVKGMVDVIVSARKRAPTLSHPVEQFHRANHRVNKNWRYLGLFLDRLIRQADIVLGDGAETGFGACVIGKFGFLNFSAERVVGKLVQ